MFVEQEMFVLRSETQPYCFQTAGLGSRVWPSNEQSGHPPTASQG